MQSMKGATSLLGSMNRQMNLPALQRIAMEFEKENDIMDQRQEMMDDAIDDVTGVDDEAEGEEVINQVLDEIGVDMSQAVCGMLNFHSCIADYVSSLERLRPDYKRLPYLMEKLRRQSVVILATTIYKRGLIV
jgi:division protein CdvB (Snf7/Vps24/ESCRT-III family)